MTKTAASLIVHGQVQADVLQRAATTDLSALPADTPNWLIPLPLWLAHSALVWCQRQHRSALLLPADTNLADLFAHSSLSALRQSISLIAVDFPHYTDGRGYSLAQLLRQWGWTGELRAVGDVMIDTVHYLARCGFDSFLLKPGHDPQQAIAALAIFTHHYQQAYRTPALPVSAP